MPIPPQQASGKAHRTNWASRIPQLPSKWLEFGATPTTTSNPLGRRLKLVASATLLVLLVTAPVGARAIRRLFEPTDLQWESPGDTELDLQVGVVRGPDALRLTVPDFELDFGITEQIELGLDGAMDFEGPADGATRYDHVDVDNLWLSLKVGLLSFQNSSRTRVMSMGLQLGPKLPTANQARGVGAESLLLLGFASDRTFLSLNLGALLDPNANGSGRPRGFEAGLDIVQSLDQGKRWSLTGEVATVRFSSADLNQLHTTLGVTYNPTDAIAFSLVGLAGLARGSDRYGVLVGVSPKLHLWGS